VEQKKPLKVAVIAVHGVGDQPPLETVRKIGDLLQDIDIPPPDPAKKPPECPKTHHVDPAYYPFREQAIRINVRPTIVTGERPAETAARNRGPFDAYVSQRMSDGGEDRDVAQEFIRGQLRCYEGEKPQDTYNTVRLEGRRTKRSPDEEERDIHIYEMYWADLSRLKAGLFSIFTELYQVLFHLSSLGVHTVNAAALQHNGDARWGRFRTLQKWATGALTVFIPVINVLMLAFAAVAVGLAAMDKLPWKGRVAVIGAVLATACVVGLGLLLWRRKPPAALWLAPVLLWIGIVAAAILWAWEHSDLDGSEWIRILESVILAGIAGVLVFLLMGAYNKRRPGALKWTWISAAIVFVAGVVMFMITPLPSNVIPAVRVTPGVNGKNHDKVNWTIDPPDAGSISDGVYSPPPSTKEQTVKVTATSKADSTKKDTVTIHLLLPGAVSINPSRDVNVNLDESQVFDIEIVPSYATISLTLTFWVREFETAIAALWGAWTVLLFLAVVVWIAGQLAVKSGDTLGRRSRWTGRLLLSLPALAFLIVTFTGWGLIGMALHGYMPNMAYRPFLPHLEDAGTIPGFISALLTGPIGMALPLVLFLAGLSLLPALWGFFPVVLPEVFPPQSWDALKLKNSDPLGRWLTSAYRWGLLVSGILLYLAITIVFPVGVILAFLTQNEGWLLNFGWLKGLGYLSGAGFAWLFAMRGRLQKLTLGFSSVLDLMLDVDNWLREFPRKSNPKARICGRYSSLLRYIANWQSPEGDGYDRIVIIAHSQGTVISADLLRFFHLEAKGGPLEKYDPELKRLDTIPIRLFTMGSPLRQAYGRRFPYLYEWATHASTAPMDPWKHRDLPRDQAPDPRELGPPGGLTLWDNAYRSGDYVGRNLWRTDDPHCGYVYSPDRMGSPHTVKSPANSTEEIPAGAPPDPENVRLEFCIGAGAHTHYWDETAPMIANELDRLIAL